MAWALVSMVSSSIRANNSLSKTLSSSPYQLLTPTNCLNLFPHSGFNTGISILGPGNVLIDNTQLKDNTNVSVLVNQVNATVVLDQDIITTSTTGLLVAAGKVVVSRSTFTFNTAFGVMARNRTNIAITDTLFAANGVGIELGRHVTADLTDSKLFDNKTPFACGSRFRLFEENRVECVPEDCKSERHETPSCCSS